MALPCWAAGHWLLKIVLAVWQYIQEFIFNSCFLLKSRYFDLASTWLLENVCARSSLSLNLNFQGKQHFLPTLIQEQVIQAAVIQCNARYPIFWQLARLSAKPGGNRFGSQQSWVFHHQRHCDFRCPRDLPRTNALCEPKKSVALIEVQVGCHSFAESGNCMKFLAF